MSYDRQGIYRYEILEVRISWFLRFEGPLVSGEGGGGGFLGANNFFPRDFHTPNIKTDVEKRGNNTYYSNEF